MVPTLQIFLSRNATLGTRELDANRPKVIWNYVRTDIRGTEQIPAGLARYFVTQLRRHGGKPQAELQARRNRYGGS